MCNINPWISDNNDSVGLSKEDSRDSIAKGLILKINTIQSENQKKIITWHFNNFYCLLSQTWNHIDDKFPLSQF